MFSFAKLEYFVIINFCNLSDDSILWAEKKFFHQLFPGNYLKIAPHILLPLYHPSRYYSLKYMPWIWFSLIGLFQYSWVFKPLQIVHILSQKGPTNYVLRVSSFSAKVDPGEEFTVPKTFQSEFYAFSESSQACYGI